MFERSETCASRSLIASQATSSRGSWIACDLVLAAARGDATRESAWFSSSVLGLCRRRAARRACARRTARSGGGGSLHILVQHVISDWCGWRGVFVAVASLCRGWRARDRLVALAVNANSFCPPTTAIVLMNGITVIFRRDVVQLRRDFPMGGLDRPPKTPRSRARETRGVGLSGWGLGGPPSPRARRAREKPVVVDYGMGGIGGPQVPPTLVAPGKPWRSIIGWGVGGHPKPPTIFAPRETVAILDHGVLVAHGGDAVGVWVLATLPESVSAG